MATQSYFGSKPVSDWQANGPAESGHNFIDQINQQQGNINEQQNRYNTQYGNIANAQNAYENAYKGQQDYGSLYAQAKESEGVKAAQDQYQRSLNAVNATQSAMNTLPSSINANSNVVLTGAQRSAALGNQMQKYANTLGYWTNQNQGDLTKYQTALGAAQNLAKGTMGQQQTRVSQTMQNAQNQMNMANQLYDQLLNERQVMRSIYGQMYEDEYQHMQDELTAWKANLDTENQRYAQEQENARLRMKLDAENQAADISKYLNSGYTWDGSQWVSPQTQTYKNWDFGNGYSVQEGLGGEAVYMKDGVPITPGEFLSATGFYGNGVQWDKWNDIWGNGVSTRGVGSDTVNAYRPDNYANMLNIANNEKYKYLY